jgi:DNA-binding MurR/RpiR family transcriptional regulator
MKSCLKRIGENYNSLTYSEKIVVNYIFKNADQVIHMPIRDLSHETGIAPSTIITMLKKFDISGYSEFKIMLASESTDSTTAGWGNIIHNENDSINLSQKVISANIDSLRELQKGLNEKQIHQAVSILYEAKNIYLFGVGASGILAQEAADYLYRLGFHCSYSSDFHHQLLFASFAEQNDVALLISQSGINNDIIQVSQILQERGIISIGISNFTGTPFSKYVSLLIAPYTILSAVHDNNFTLRIPILCILEIIYYAIGEKMGNHFYKTLDSNQQIVKGQTVKFTDKSPPDLG